MWKRNIGIVLYSAIILLFLIAINRAFSMSFVPEVYGNSEMGLFYKILCREGMPFLISLLILLIGLGMMIITAILWLMKVNIPRSLFSMAKFIFVCGGWFTVNNEVITFVFQMSEVFAVINILCQYGISIFSLECAISYCTKENRVWLSIYRYIVLVFVLFTSIAQVFTDYHYSDFMLTGIILNGFMILLIALSLLYEAKKNKGHELHYVFISVIPLIVGGMAEIVNYFYGDLKSSVIFLYCFTIFSIIHLGYYISGIKRALQTIEKTKEMEMEVIQQRIATMLSQMQPHFLFNSLTAIKQLCDIDPKVASKAIERFSLFLRRNLDSLKEIGLIPFEKEMEHAEQYLYLEQMRFGEKVCVKYDFEVTDFMLPPLTVQPIVENAIRYGISKKENGGTVTIGTKEDENDFTITVQDDGVGFDLSIEKVDGNTHIGIENVKNRIKAQCNGELEIESEVGMGTKVVIRLPKEECERKENVPTEHKGGKY